MQPEQEWVTGLVVPGEGRGRPLGFPTANLALTHPKQIPTQGIYAVWGRILPNKKKLAGALHVGPRQMFGDPIGTVELHFLHFPDRDMYGAQIAFQIVKRLRAVETFETVEELIVALREDCAAAEKILLAA